MCLITCHSEPKIAREDITVYKALHKAYELIDKKRNYNDVPCKVVIYGKEYTGIITSCKYTELLIGIRHGDAPSNNNIIYFSDNNYEYYRLHPEYINELTIDGKSIIKLVYKTVYQRVIVEIGNTYKSEINYFMRKVEEGLHSYRDLAWAKMSERKDAVYVKCIIPKGSYYYEGSFCDYPSYASDTLKYVEIV
jgi:hypothetical protein